MTSEGQKIFIGGSRRLSRLSQDVKHRIDNIIDKGFTIIVGDANGVDKSVQQYINSRSYKNVIVFCMENACRNNLGGWPTKRISAAGPGRRDFSYYSTKDRAMAEESDYGLMLWDGRSRGTLTNIVHLVREGKAVVVYFAPDKSFHTVRQFDHEIPRVFDLAAIRRIDAELGAIPTRSSGRNNDTAPLF